MGRSRTSAPLGNAAWNGYPPAPPAPPPTRADLVTLLDWEGPSAVFFPTLRYSPLASLELTLGYQDAVGDVARPTARASVSSTSSPSGSSEPSRASAW
jgi:hypothetical protein